MNRRRISFARCSLVLLLFVLAAPQAWATCELCKGHHTNRACKEDTAGKEGCKTGLLGQCINGDQSCSGGTCGDGAGGCEPEHQTQLDRVVPAQGEVLLEPAAACTLPGLILEA